MEADVRSPSYSIGVISLIESSETGTASSRNGHQQNCSSVEREIVLSIQQRPWLEGVLTAISTQTRAPISWAPAPSKHRTSDSNI
ncbi:hypothetical protein CRUP_025666 [Coryphaenoides rupestris]|nr:hypothetical protein CRUP_025666 [Coryphaenoides rupestris]